MQLHDLTEAEWDLIRDLIPRAASVGRARPGTVRAYVNGVLWRMRTGQPWHQMPREYGHHKSISARFTQWQQSGVWQDVTGLLAQARTRNSLLPD